MQKNETDLYPQSLRDSPEGHAVIANAMPGAIAAATFCESLADASVAAADAAFASLYDGMQKKRD